MFTSLMKAALFAVVSLTIAASPLLVSANAVRPQPFGHPSARNVAAEPVAQRATAIPVTKIKRSTGPPSTFLSRRQDAYNLSNKRQDQDAGNSVPVEGLVGPVNFNGQEYQVLLFSNGHHGFIYDTADPADGFAYDVAADKGNTLLDGKVSDTDFGNLEQYSIGSTVIGGVEVKDLGVAKRPHYGDGSDPPQYAGGIGLGLSSEDHGTSGWEASGFVELNPTIYSYVLDDKQNGQVIIGARPANLGEDYFTISSVAADAWTVSGTIYDNEFTADFSLGNGPSYAPKDVATAVFQQLGLVGEEGTGEAQGLLTAKVPCGQGPDFTIDFGNGNQLTYTKEYTTLLPDDRQDCIFFLVGADQGEYPYAYTLGGSAFADIAVVMDATDLTAPVIGFGSLKPAGP